MLEGILLVLEPREELKHPGVSESCCGRGLPLLPNNHPLLPGSLQPLREVGGGEPVVGVEPDHRADISEDSLYDKWSICAQVEGTQVGRPRGKVKGVEGTGRGIAVLFQTVAVILGKAKVKDKEGGGWQEMVSTLHKAKAKFSLARFHSCHKARVCSSTLSQPRTFRVEHWQARALKAKAGKVGGVSNQGGGGELLRIWYQLLPKC